MKEPIKQYKPTEKLELPKIKKEFPKVFKKVHCPSCSEVVGVENITLEKSLAKCNSCEVIFSIEEEVASLKVKNEVKQEFFRPEGIDLFYYKDDLEISLEGQPSNWDISWFGLFLLGTGLGFLLHFDKGYSFMIPFLSILGTLYFTFRILNYKKNRVYIDVNDQALTVKGRPGNYKKDQVFLAEDIDQIYLKNSTTQATMKGTYYVNLFVIVNGPNGQYHERLLAVSTLAKAKYLEQEIEKYLGIEDRKVPESNV